MTAEPCSSRKNWIDFDIHGVLGVRLLDPRSRDTETVRRQLGPVETQLQRDPDVRLRFVRHLDRDATRTGGRIAINFEAGCDMHCQSGLRSIPGLLPMLSLAALKKDHVAIHGSAFVHKGIGVLMAGHARSGKTTALVGFASLGAEFGGDDWLLLSREGDAMYGLPIPIDLSPRHVESSSIVRHAIGKPRRILFQILGGFVRTHQKLFGSDMTTSFTGRAMRKILTGLQRHIVPPIHPGQLFTKCAKSARPQKVFLFVRHDKATVEVAQTDPSEMANELASLSEHEQHEIMELYKTHRLSSSKRKHILFECAVEWQRAILADAIAGLDSYTVRHPYPVRFCELYDKIAPFLEVKTSQVQLAVCS